MLTAAVLLAVLTGPQISTDTVEADPHRLVEIRVDAEPPEGFVVASQEWLILDASVDWRQYDNGSVLVATAPAGEYQARWRGQYIDWENKQFRSEWRVYTIRIRGPPVGPDKPDPVNPTPGRIASVVILRSPGLTQEQNLGLLRIRQSETFAGGTPRLLILDSDGQTPAGQPDPLVKKYDDQIPAGAFYPYYFALDNAGGVVDSGEVGNADEWLTKIGRALR